MITRLVISSLAVLISALTLDGVTVDPWWWAVIIAIVLGLINSWIRPLVKLLALPINLLTLGLFTFIINGAMVLLCSWLLHRLQHRDDAGQLDAAPVLSQQEEQEEKIDNKLLANS